MNVETINKDGRDRVLLDLTDYQDLIDARDHAIAMREIAFGAVTLTSAEMVAYLDAASPLAFWRNRAGKTQADLAAEVGITQPFLAQIEAGRRKGSVGVLMRLARVLGVRVEDLVEL